MSCHFSPDGCSSIGLSTGSMAAPSTLGCHRRLTRNRGGCPHGRSEWADRRRGTMAKVLAEREALIARYESGPGRLKAALAMVPPEALQWRPAPGEWSAHEIVVHCADSEANAALRIRYL